MFFRWKLLEKIAQGEMPPGMSEDDLRAMGMPLPGEVELIEEPDGQVTVRKVTPKPAIKKPAANFVCDAPDNE